jgi:hypothetical protein
MKWLNAEFVVMQCYANGSLARQRVREFVCGADSSWGDFDAAITSTVPGNDGVLGSSCTRTDAWSV